MLLFFGGNSPGGSAIVSDMLWARIFQLKNENETENNIKSDPWRMIPGYFERIKDAKSKRSKRISNFWKTKDKKETPIYVSQSDVAASGGYFLSAVSNHVYSSPVSITGSIGVISGKFNVQSALKKIRNKPTECCHRRPIQYSFPVF